MSAPGRWLRLNVGTFESEWLIDLPPMVQFTWVRLLIYVKSAGHGGRAKILGPTAVKRLWRIPPDVLRALEDAAQRDGALRIEGGEWIVENWDAYQKPDPTASQRQRRYRQEKHQLTPLQPNTPDRGVIPTHHTVTRHATETETETETKTKKKTALPNGWKPHEKHAAKADELNLDLDGEATSFVEYHHSKANRYADWDLAFFTWLRKAAEFGRTNKAAPRRHERVASDGRTLLGG